jgi:heterodisulfide reductase subunit A2
VGGKAGNFTVEVLTHPRYVDMTRCVACGACAEKCPRKVEDEYNAGLSDRKAAYVKYAQAVPLKYVIDPVNCIYFQKGKCRACEKLCSAQAVDFKQTEQRRSIRTGSIILAPGFAVFDPARNPAYRYGMHSNVLTSLEFERVLSATGPYKGHLRLPSDDRVPKKIAWLQCIGSRDLHGCDHPYCSSVCCMYAIKQAIVAKEHAPGDLDCAIFYIDMRTHGKDFDKYLEEAKKKHGIRFIQCRVPSIDALPGKDDLVIPYVQDGGEQVEEAFDMVILSVGLEVSQEALESAQRLDVKLTEGGFCRTGSFNPSAASREGVYVCGAFAGPKDIPQSVIEAGAAACAATERLATARHSLTRRAFRPLERDVTREVSKIGIFICNCGKNIGGVIDVPEVARYAKTLPRVAYVEENLFTCSQDTQDKMMEILKKEGLNRIVVAACTPRTHESLFQETMVRAGLNKYLLEMANVRNQDSWVHAGDPEGATEKAKDLIRMAVAKVALMNPAMETDVPICGNALVVGGGISGMTAAKSLSAHGYRVHLVERSALLGGQARHLFKTWREEDVQENLEALIQSVTSDPNIEVHLGAQVGKVDGFVGNFRSTLSSQESEEEVDHGVVVIATGAEEYKPREYLCGHDPRVVTHLELDRMFQRRESRLKEIKTAVFIQCVGSREPERPYCSKVCCTHTMVSALHLKALNPDMNLYILYRDIRTYGEKEYLYRRARLEGVIFIPYKTERKPLVSASEEGLSIEVMDQNLREKVRMKADLLVLASAIVPCRDENLARLFKIPVNEDGFFVEAHAKLGPSEFATPGLFLCGMAHYPKPIDESVAQAQSAASRALTVLSRESISVGGVVSSIAAERCSACLGCVDVCPYSAISMNRQGTAVEVNEALCKGCGACAAACPSEALMLTGFNHTQLYAQIKSALS